jgi:DNA-binding LytR/AlgR family response regulator
MTSFEVNGHNYLSIAGSNKEPLKIPLGIKDLETVLLLSKSQEKRKKTRLIVKRGVVNIALLLVDIPVIYTKNKLVYVIDRHSKKYSIDKTLAELEEKLDYDLFFRANRQYIININFVRSFKTYKKVKLILDIGIPELEEPVIISQQVTRAFKKWMEEG